MYSPSDIDGSSTALIMPHAPALTRLLVRDMIFDLETLGPDLTEQNLQNAQAKTVQHNVLLPRWHLIQRSAGDFLPSCAVLTLDILEGPPR